jgi:hypothetical protein
MRGILLRREDHIAFLQKERHPQTYISQSYKEHSYTSHEHHKQSHNLISSISWWSKHTREAHLYGIWYKCSLWYKYANMIWYINENATCICTSTFPTEAQKGKTNQSSLWDMGTPGSPPTRLMAIPDKWVWPTRRPADLSVGPTDLVAAHTTSWKPSRRFPRRPNPSRPQDLAYKTIPRWTSPKADRRDMERCVM